MGAREYCEFRWRSRRSNDLRPIRWWVQSHLVDGHAVRRGTVPPGVGSVRWGQQSSGEGTVVGTVPAIYERARAGTQRSWVAPEDGLDQAERRRQRSHREAESAATRRRGTRRGPEPNAPRRLVTHRGWQDHHPAIVLRCGARSLQKRADVDRQRQRRRKLDAFAA